MRACGGRSEDDSESCLGSATYAASVFAAAGLFCAADVTRVGSLAVLDGATRIASFEFECSCESLSTDQTRSGTPVTESARACSYYSVGTYY